MSSSATHPESNSLKKGTYSPSTTSDLRSPCPVVNCLANHGYIPRDGRNVHAGELATALIEVGLAPGLRNIFAHPIFLEYKEPQNTVEQNKKQTSQQSRSFLTYVWYLARNPWAVLFSAFGMRNPGQVDATGRKCLNLDQLALPGVVEHDISLTRHDHQQGNNISRQPDLIRELLAASSDGGQTLTAEDRDAEGGQSRLALRTASAPDRMCGDLAHPGRVRGREGSATGLCSRGL